MGADPPAPPACRGGERPHFLVQAGSAVQRCGIPRRQQLEVRGTEIGRADLDVVGVRHEVGVVADAARLKRRRCQYVIRSLETLGFLDRLGEYDPSSRLSLQYRVRLKPARIETE